MAPVRLDVTWSDFLDRLTIQELKAARLPHPARELAANQLETMRECLVPDDLPAAVFPLLDALRRVNGDLWETEAAIRALREQGDEGPDFVALAQAILTGNDRRAAIKHEIDTLLDEPAERKHYACSGHGAART